MGQGLKATGGNPASPPYRNGPYNWDQHVTFTKGINGIMNGGTTYYVDSSRTTSGNGKSWTKAFITIAEAVAASLAASGHHDTILIKGTDNVDSDADPVNDYSESVTIDATQVGLRIIGMGNGPEGVKWTVGTQDEVILTINAIDCVVENIRFRPNGATSSAAIYLAQNVDSSKVANGAQIRNCIFRSTTETALAGIYTQGASDVIIENNVFSSVATAVLQTETPAKVTYRMRIRNNFVDDKCTNGFVFSGRSCLIENNEFAGASLTTIINTISCSDQGSYNVVRGHRFMVATAFETNCVGSTTDDWWGNDCDDITSQSVVGTNADNAANYGQVHGYPQA